jgi:tRNA(Ile)-lysidine synthase
MVSPGDRVVVAVSGGPDSVCLLHLLLQISQELNLQLFVAHLNHMLREEAIEEENFVRELAEKYSLPFYSERIEVAKKLRKGETLEEGARRIRYDFLRRAGERFSANKIALGHNADDLVETVLLNLIRGTGIRGLRGIPPVRKEGSITFIRPLIEIWREEITQYLKERNIPYMIDRSNLSLEFTRNKIRHRVIPLLEEINPKVKLAIHRLGEIAGEINSFIEDEVRKEKEQILVGKSESSLLLDIKRLFAFHPALQKEIIRSVLAEFTNYEMGREEIERILEVGRRGGAITLPGKIDVRRVGDVLQFKKGKERKIEYEIPLKIPGGTSIPEAKMRIEAEIIEGQYLVKDASCREVTLDMEGIKGRLIARNWRKGDRFIPLGMRNKKKLQDIFVDKKIPREERGRIPIICDEEGIIWVVGVAISERVKVGERTRRVLYLRAIPEEES